jgi:hypothetical protein
MRNHKLAKALMMLLYSSFLLASPTLADEQPPLQRGPIYDGRQHQPTESEILGRELLKGGGSIRALGDRGTSGDELYQRIMEQSQKSIPRTLDGAR